ncbi:transposase, IS4 family [Singulisphaera sp. GP187]|uniref:IS4 family transposase n=1 Tax=Singulisphaera sp. GP187 TaxID=1882752 RepID=UPI00092976A0|nr:IS4 family transposase [Singulisphaera sp. GP187]SIO65156.1 transposase, IS4 family [Singulisphaera sp. GP187]
MPQGHCTLPADDAGRILDRLAGLEQMISPAEIRQALAATGRVNSRCCRLSHEIVLWVVLAMGLLTDLPIRQVFKHARRLRKGEASPHRSGLCLARQRLGVAPVRHLFHQVVRPLARPETPGAFYHDWRLMGVDGTIFDVPDSEANATVFARPLAGPRGEGAFPQIRKLSLVELGTHVEVGLVVRSSAHGEQSMIGGLFRHLTPEMLLLWDRGFLSYELRREMTAREVKVLARVKSLLILRPIKHLADGSYLAKISKNAYDREKDRDGIVVRVIRYTLDDPQRVGNDEEHVLITNLLDSVLYPAMELILLYHERWEEELVFDEQKTHQDPRRATKPAQLRSETPAGVIQEVYALSLGHFVIRSLMFEAAATVGLDPDRLSFTGCFQILKCRLPECDGTTPTSLESWYEGLLWEMQGERSEPRRNRINPRVIKRKMSKWKKKRPEHRRIPPLKKTFPETVVMSR